jgi:RNA-directed DNA polymerase
MEKPKSAFQQKTEGWRQINWKQIERRVFKLQKLIYTASRCGDMQRVRKLQKTLMQSWSGRVLAVRRVTQDNQGKKTAGVDGVKSLSPTQRLDLAMDLHLRNRASPTRRVWIPKPGKMEKRPLGIPVMGDRGVQALVKLALEPEWEARFEPNSYGFRPGRSCHDAIRQIKNCIHRQAKFVLDADIAHCFDRIDHQYLLNKLNVKGRLRQQLKAWLKAGALELGRWQPTSMGTPQGGVLSPLLANIALHGLEERIKTEFPSDKWKKIRSSYTTYGYMVTQPVVIRYADDFVILSEELRVIERCREILAEWLQDVGLALRPDKTRLTHTLEPALSEDGIAGFDFLGHHIQQYPTGKYHAAKVSATKRLGYKTLITPTKQSIKRHQARLGEIVHQFIAAPQAALIRALNPVIRGWTRFYRVSNAQNVGELSRQDHLLYLKLRRWAKRRCRSAKTAMQKYWKTQGNNHWIFACETGRTDPLRLLQHKEFGSNINAYVKVKGDKSPFDGDWVYWSTRLKQYPGISRQQASLLKRQQGKCAWCGLYFHTGDVLEIDHQIPRSCGGQDHWQNQQLLHRHCHDVKTTTDGSGRLPNDKGTLFE